MAAKNKPPVYKMYKGGTAPIIWNLPVQAGSTQEIKVGEVCKMTDPTDIASSPIIPVSLNETEFVPLIAWEEQKATDAARLMQFAVATPEVAFEFDLNAGTAVKIGDKIQMHDSQTVKVSSSYTVAAAVIEPVNETPTWQTVTKVFVTFGFVRADALKHIPFTGAAVAGNISGLDSMDDVGVLAYTAGKLLLADGDSYEENAMSGDATIATGGALTLAKKQLANVIADPGDGEAIVVTLSGTCPLVTSGAETRTVADATYAGQEMLLAMKTDNGDCVVTFASPFNQAGDTTITFDTAGDAALFMAIEDGADVEWRLIAEDGCSGMIGAGDSDLDTVIADPGDAGAIPVTGSGTVPLVTGAGAETRTLADATYAGQRIALSLKTDGGGACVITVASPINADGRTTLTFADAGDSVLLYAVEDGADVEWRVASAIGIEGLDIDTDDIAETANGGIGVPMLIQSICTAAGAEDEVVLVAAPRKLKIVDAWMIARTADAANVTLKNVANAFTGAIAIGGVDDTIVSFATIIAEHDEVAAGAAINATFSAAGSAEIFILAVPTA